MPIHLSDSRSTPFDPGPSVSFARGFYDVLAEFLPGDTTLNELRALTAVAEAAVQQRETSVSEISATSGIAKTTVSRLIGHWIAEGTIRENPHPNDGRRRILSFSDEAHELNQIWAQRLESLLEAR